MKNKRIWLYVIAAAVSVGILVLCFLAPSMIEKHIESGEDDVRILESSAISYSASENDTINIISMLGGGLNNLSVTELDDGSVYDREKALAHARRLMSSFALALDLQYTNAAAESDKLMPAIDGGHSVFYLYDKDGTPHSALLWSFDFMLEKGGMASVTFDDATGALLRISLPVLEDIGSMDFISDSGNMLYLSQLLAMEYAELSGLRADGVLPMGLREEYIAENDYAKIEYCFAFDILSSDGQAEPVQGMWVYEEGKNIMSLDIVIAPGLEPASALPAAEEPADKSGGQ